MQCNASNIKTTAKQVWLYFTCRTTQPGYEGTTKNLQIDLNTPKNPYLNPHLNQAIQKNTCRNFLPKKILESKIPPKNPLIIPSLEIQSTPPGAII